MDRDLSALIERVEQLSGPDREVDGLVWSAITGLECYYPNPYVHQADGQTAFVDDGRWLPTPAITASVDAVLALVERVLPGWDVSLHIDNGSALAGIAPASEDGCTWTDNHGATPALAILLALLRALRSRETGDG